MVVVVKGLRLPVGQRLVVGLIEAGELGVMLKAVRFGTDGHLEWCDAFRAGAAPAQLTTSRERDVGEL
jgi:hypothetical protein